MSILAPFLAVLLVALLAAYHRWPLAVFAALAGAALVAAGLLGAHLTTTIVLGAVLALIVLPLLVTPLRQAVVSSYLLRVYSRMLPQLSDTERTALEAGTVGFEGELFSGMPQWDVLLAQPKPELTAEEQAFLDGP